MKASELKPGQFPQGTEARVCQDIAERQAMGTAKYGTTVERNPLCLLEWIEHAYQECLDQAVYLKRAMEELQTGKNVTGWDEPQSEPAKEYRCFHCGEVFDATGAAEHFGTQMITFPACTIDVAEYRRMEEQTRQYREEDTDLHKQIHALNAEMLEKVRRAEEDGYARGLRDAKAHPEELGLQPIAEVPPPPQLQFSVDEFSSVVKQSLNTEPQYDSDIVAYRLVTPADDLAARIASVASQVDGWPAWKQNLASYVDCQACGGTGWHNKPRPGDEACHVCSGYGRLAKPAPQLDWVEVVTR